MAEITGNGAVDNAGHVKHTWPNLTNGDTGKPINSKTISDRSVQVTGTFGTGGQVDIEGSNDGGTTWSVLNDPQGNPITLTDNSIVAILEYVEQLRPNVSAGDVDTDLTVHLVGRKSV